MNRREFGAEYVMKLTAAGERLQRKHGSFRLEMDFAALFGLIGTIQLALRHPRFESYVADMMRRLLEDIYAAVARTEPEAAQLLRLGEDPTWDRPFDGDNSGACP